MPYADPEKQREAQRRWYNAKRADDPAFVKKEKKRVRAWKKENREELLPKMREYSKTWYQRKKKTAKKRPKKK